MKGILFLSVLCLIGFIHLYATPRRAQGRKCIQKCRRIQTGTIPGRKGQIRCEIGQIVAIWRRQTFMRWWNIRPECDVFGRHRIHSEFQCDDGRQSEDAQYRGNNDWRCAKSARFLVACRRSLKHSTGLRTLETWNLKYYYSQWLCFARPNRTISFLLMLSRWCYIIFY